jgi:hypothetical protein
VVTSAVGTTGRAPGPVRPWQTSRGSGELVASVAWGASTAAQSN